MVNNPYNQYMKSSIMTTPPEELAIMLYEGAMKFLKRAMIYLEDKNIEKVNEAILKVQDITIEFMSKVDTEYEVGKQLFSLYEYIYRRLIEANMKKDPEILNEIYGMYEELRDTWQEAIKIARRGK
ncbi:MAG: flagellar export chaperone FliS [Maledivibacter sp.]|nr:flagellar export chaperone FliS [Maledivibacter sp.]